ncbi:MAG: hypothetical protein V1718_02230 [archaeon]
MDEMRKIIVPSTGPKREMKMKREYFTEFVLENGKITEQKISKRKAISEINQLLKKDKDFLKIMAKM